MKLEFKIENSVHTFRANGSINSNDLITIKTALKRYLVEVPRYLILDLSEASGLEQLPAELVSKTLDEVRTAALARKLVFITAHTLAESKQARASVYHQDLDEKMALLRSRQTIRDDLRRTAQQLMQENQNLKAQLDELKNNQTPSPMGSLASFLDRLWMQR